MKKKLGALSVCLLMAAGAQSAVISWVGGGVDSEWNTAENWSSGTLPGDSSVDRALISAGDSITVTSSVISNNKFDLHLNSSSATLLIAADMGDFRRMQDIQGTVTQTAGTLSFTDASYGSIQNGGSWTISGGSLTMAGILDVKDGGTFSVVGTDAAVNVGTDFTLSDTGTLTFEMALDGVSTIDVGDIFTVDAATSVLSIDASAITENGDFDLVSFDSMVNEFGTDNITITGLAEGLTASISYDADSMNLNVVPEPATIGMLGLGGILVMVVRRRVRG